MLITQIISPNRVYIDDHSLSKAGALLQLSQLLAKEHNNLEPQFLFDAFWERETLGSTAVGHGVAIPHIRLDNINCIIGSFIKMQHPIDFRAEDKQPIDLIFGFMVPITETQQHLSTLAQISGLFVNENFRAACRATNDKSSLFQLLTQHDSKQSSSQSNTKDLIAEL